MGLETQTAQQPRSIGAGGLIWVLALPFCVLPLAVVLVFGAGHRLLVPGGLVLVALIPAVAALVTYGVLKREGRSASRAAPFIFLAAVMALNVVIGVVAFAIYIAPFGRS